MTDGETVALPPAARWRDQDVALFDATVLAAAEALNVQPLAVEKDYWVCEALRAITTAYPANLVFKGGTSLEKLRIVERFSEDLDLLVIGDIGGTNAAKRALKDIIIVAATATGDATAADGATSGGNPGSFHRQAYLAPPLMSVNAAGIADAEAILVELGQSGGSHPSEVHKVESLLARALAAPASSVKPDGWADLAPIEVTILHPGRTLIEKLLRVNNFALRPEAQGEIHGWPRIGRQFYDIWALLGEQSVLDLLADKEAVTGILDSVAQVSAAFKGDEPVPAGGFAMSPVFDPNGPFAGALKREHDTAIQNLYYGDLSRSPTFGAVLDRIHEHSDALDLEG